VGIEEDYKPFYYLCQKELNEMRRLIYIILMLFPFLAVHAQSEGGKALHPDSQVKDFGGFILDMGSMLNAESLVVSAPFLPSLSYLAPLDDVNLYQLNPDAFKLNPNITYMGGTAINPSRTSILSLLHTGIGSGMVNWQGTSFKLNNGMRINFYGEYDADGNKVYNPSALPWQRNNFNAAFEMKSANGNFGIKVEVHGGRNNPY
jgi:hypothetical protein